MKEVKKQIMEMSYLSVLQMQVKCIYEWMSNRNPM